MVQALKVVFGPPAGILSSKKGEKFNTNQRAGNRPPENPRHKRNQ